jgi:ATP-dependent Clp protease ATP-binding subunit ClpA
LIRENDSVAARILDRMAVSLSRIRSEVERQVTRGDSTLGQEMQLTPRGKRVFDLAYDEARQIKNEYIGTEHLLLGLIREGEGLAGRVLAKLGVDLERTRLEVLALQDRKPEMPESRKTTTSMEDRMHELFARTFQELPAEQQQALLGDGLPLDQVDEVPRKLIALIFEHTIRGGDFVLSPQALVRVNITKADGKLHFTITTPVTFLTNLLVKETA